MSSSPLRLTTVAADDGYALVDVLAGEDVEVPGFVHRREEATVHLLSGALTVELDGVRHELGPGDLLRLPRDVPTAIRFVGDVRLLCLVAPGGIERLAELARPPLPVADDVAAVLAAAGVSLLPASVRSRP